jgi:hypothetical protein
MKKTLLVVLELVMALILVMGLASIVSAAPQRLSITNVSLQLGNLQFDYGWDKHNAYSYHITVYRGTIGGGGGYSYQQTFTLDGRTPSYSDSLTVSSDIIASSNYTIYLYTYDKNGRMNGQTSSYAGQLP